MKENLTGVDDLIWNRMWQVSHGELYKRLLNGSSSIAPETLLWDRVGDVVGLFARRSHVVLEDRVLKHNDKLLAL